MPTVDSVSFYRAVENKAVRAAEFVRDSACFRSIWSVKEWVGTNFCPRSSQFSYSSVPSAGMKFCPAGYKRLLDQTEVNPATRIMTDGYSSDKEVDVSSEACSQNDPVRTQPGSRQSGANKGMFFSEFANAGKHYWKQKTIPDVEDVSFQPGDGLESFKPLSLPPLPEEMEVAYQRPSSGNKPAAGQIINNSTGEGDWAEKQTTGTPANIVSKEPLRKEVINLDERGAKM